jgi:hypothetical protein
VYRNEAGERQRQDDETSTPRRGAVVIALWPVIAPDSCSDRRR